MTRPLLAVLGLLAGCASAIESNSLRATLPSASLVLCHNSAELDVPLVMAAVPVQLGAWAGPERLPDGNPAIVMARVPQGVATLHAVQAPEVEPTLVGTQIYPRFDYRAVPLLPYGAFWVGLANTTDQPITVRPSELKLVMGRHAASPIVNSGALAGRWSLSLLEMTHKREGRPHVGWAVRKLHDALPVMENPVVVPAHGTWRGFVVFDTGAYTADEYAALLDRVGQATLRLERDGQKPVELGFVVQRRPLDAVCLPDTTEPSFRRCEILAELAKSGAIRSREASNGAQ